MFATPRLRGDGQQRDECQVRTAGGAGRALLATATVARGIRERHFPAPRLHITGRAGLRFQRHTRRHQHTQL